MKNKVLVSFIVVIIIIILSGLILIPFLNRQKQSHTFAVWWWNDELDESYLDFASEQGINEIYYCSSKFNEETSGFIKSASKKGMSVFWLAGEYQWISDYDKLSNKINKYLEYQKNYKYDFKGIHLDIEPHQHPEFKTKRKELLTQFVGLSFKIKNDFPSLYVEYDLPFWLDDEIEYDGITKSAYEFIIDNATKVTIMSYRDTSEKIYDVAKEEVEYALSINKEINLSVNTKSSEGDNVSFMEEGKLVMLEEINKLKEILPKECGVVIHHMEAWYNLKD